jgi:hypothetical protein
VLRGELPGKPVVGVDPTEIASADRMAYVYMRKLCFRQNPGQVGDAAGTVD